MSSLQEFQTARAQLKNKLELIDWQLKNILEDRQLRNSHDMIELQIERLTLLDKLRFLRPSNSEDISYRQNVVEDFSLWAKEHILDNLNLVFHATGIANTERILNSGRITSGKDRWTIRTSGDGSGEISVSTKGSLFVSLAGHMDLLRQEFCLPAGCLFVLQADEKRYQMAKDDNRIPNVQLRKNPNQLYAIVTTPENIGRVKWWAQKNGFSSDKVFDFQGVQEKIEEDNLFYSLMNYHYQNQKT